MIWCSIFILDEKLSIADWIEIFLIKAGAVMIALRL
jgi:uncharacterized membrane protein